MDKINPAIEIMVACGAWLLFIAALAWVMFPEWVINLPRYLRAAILFTSHR